MSFLDAYICVFYKVWEAFGHYKNVHGSVVKNPPAMQEMWVQSLGQEDAQEEKMVTYSSILAWKIPWTEEPGRLQSVGSQRVGHD